ncbi:fibro-slime domain-containing protein [Sorangium sp. So ce1389]|uniref:fibro-slime domain-containing protein n=1 Tax=Sorangium sp. So ce1389 TaxID=3133336 RepID=UPI003F64493C
MRTTPAPAPSSRRSPPMLAVLLMATLVLPLAGCAASPENIARRSELSSSSDAGPGAGSGSSDTGAGGGFAGVGGGPGGSSSAGGGGEDPCRPRLEGIVRDFKAFDSPGGHPDFERWGGDIVQGIVEVELGADHKPVYAFPGPPEESHTEGREAFDQWFRDVPEVNRSIRYTIPLDVSDQQLRIFFDKDFFPIDDDDRSWGNEGRDHNYSFTFELHMMFKYRRGDVFIFGGDDDIWVFIDRKLAIDMGGVHSPASWTLDLDTLAGEIDLEVGREYPIDIFFAERRSGGSELMFTTLAYTNCEPIIR